MSRTIAEILHNKSILENEICNKICDFEEKYNEVEIVDVELQTQTFASVGISGTECGKSYNVKVKINIKQ